MKKTLAAVLAAMMALSTATVAFAKDTDVKGSTDDRNADLVVAESGKIAPVKYGSPSKFVLQVGDYKYDLGTALEAKQIKIDVTVTEGRSLLKAAPSVALGKTTNDDGDEVKCAVVSLNVKDTFNTDTDKSDEDIAIRVRVTALEKCELLGLEKGDTLSVDELLFSAYYDEITAYGKDMTITSTERDNNYVVVDASDLIAVLEEKDTELGTFYFGDTAAFSAKISNAQKDVNLHYETKVSDDYYEAYPELSFEAIQFQGAPKFLRKGTLTFNAIGDKNTVVYEVTDDGLVELESDYDSTYGTVTVEGISALTSYVVASEALEVEDDAAAETPAVEESNPATGAC